MQGGASDRSAEPTTTAELAGPSQAAPAEPAETPQQEASPQEMNLSAASDMIANHDASALQQMAQNGELPFRGQNAAEQPAEQPAAAPVGLGSTTEGPHEQHCLQALHVHEFCGISRE